MLLLAEYTTPEANSQPLKSHSRDAQHSCAPQTASYKPRLGGVRPCVGPSVGTAEVYLGLIHARPVGHVRASDPGSQSELSRTQTTVLPPVRSRRSGGYAP